MMLTVLKAVLEECPDTCAGLFRRYVDLGKKFLVRSELWDEFRAFCEANEAWPPTQPKLAQIISGAQEAAVEGTSLYLAVRYQVARWNYLRVDVETLMADEVSVADYLAAKERLVPESNGQGWTLEFDMEPFNREFFQLQESRSIGRGVEFLNRRLSSDLFDRAGHGAQQLLGFLRAHKYRGKQLMLNGRIENVIGLRDALRAADELLADRPKKTPWADLEAELRPLGFEPGWGLNAERTLETMTLLTDILEAPEPSGLERFLSRIPMIFSLLIVSPHGYFAQSGVLGRPDTGGQVVYILDQVRALDKEMRRGIAEQGLDIEPSILILTRQIPEADGTTCNQRLEHVDGAEHARILRVPFRDDQGDVIPYWISRFKIWPYLERFASDAEAEVIAELGGRPDLIVGNYSDGNLVATLLSRNLGVTQCNISHALEKTKYLYSALYWKQNEEQYHFSCQFTADLIAMNAAEFIITSTYQEIAGTTESIGQYESYSAFSMPGLYRVVKGINVFDPKFNIVSPGADVEVYFPYTQTDRRPRALTQKVEEMVRDTSLGDARGSFGDPDKPVLFTMARLDHIKNIAGLIDWYGRSPRLRGMVNLLVVAGRVHENQSTDTEERKQIERVHSLMDQHGLDDQVRWLGVYLDKMTAGELYRWVADSRGAFVQPALFEAFGLTVIEAMSTGLPTFATRWGGPLEIIQEGISGFHVDPNHGDRAADIIADFFEAAARDQSHWHSISEGALGRVRSRYTWELYAERMMTLSRIYGFWRHITNLERAEAKRYLEMFYALEYRPLAAAVPRFR